MYLLSAIWLHDIGMMYGIFKEKEKDPSELKDPIFVNSLREKHETRTTQYITDIWKEHCFWTQQEKNILSNICYYHRKKNKIASCPTRYKSLRNGKPIRLVVLAAILRLVDACHIDQSRAPGPLKQLYLSVGMKEDSAFHWERSDLIVDVDFDRNHKRIHLIGVCPPKIKYDLFTFDLQDIIEIVQQEVQEELDSVQQILLSFKNTHFLKVEPRVDHLPYLDDKKRDMCISYWPYLLNKPTSSSEAAATLCKIIQFLIDSVDKNDYEKYKKKILHVVKHTSNSRQYDLLTRNISLNIEALLNTEAINEETFEKISNFAESTLKKITINCQKIADFARKLIEDKDVLIVHGFSTNIAKLLESLKGEYSNTLFIVNCEKFSKYDLDINENKRIITFAQQLGFRDIKFLLFSTIPSLFHTIKEMGRNTKLLLGTHGKLKGHDYLCKPGSEILATLAHEIGVEVIVFSEENKFLINGKQDHEVAGYDKLFRLNMTRFHEDFKVDCLTPEIDRVPFDYIDKVITENKVYTSKEFAEKYKATEKRLS